MSVTQAVEFTEVPKGNHYVSPLVTIRPVEPLT